MATWGETIPGYDQMSPDEQKRARDKWNAYLDEKWGSRIEGYDQMDFWQREAAKEKWVQDEALRVETERQNNDLEEYKRKSEAAQAEQRQRAERIRADYEARMADMQRKQEEQQIRGNNLMAMYQSRANALANPKKSSFDGESTEGMASQSGGVGGTLLTNRSGIEKPKLGGRSRLGGKSLLGG